MKPEQLTAVITGAGSGVGAAVAKGLAAQGIRVVLVGRTFARLERVQAAIHDSGGSAMIVPADVASPEDVGALYTAVVARWGDPHILFNNAGLHCELLPIAETTPEDWIQSFSVNTIGPYLVTRAFMGGMIRQGWGRIINVSSAASIGAPGNIGAVYQLSKVTLNHFTRQLAVELAGTGVTANAIHPGEVRTEMWASIKAEASRREGPGRDMLGWAQMVEETGGDPPEKTVDLVRELLDDDTTNGEFLWIRDGLQAPRPAW